MRELGPRGDAEPHEDLAEVVLDGAGRDVELRGDLLIAGAGSRESRDLRLLGVRLSVGAERLRTCSPVAPAPRASETRNAVAPMVSKKFERLAQRVARFLLASFPSEPFAAEQLRARDIRRHRRARQLVERDPNCSSAASPVARTRVPGRGARRPTVSPTRSPVPPGARRPAGRGPRRRSAPRTRRRRPTRPCRPRCRGRGGDARRAARRRSGPRRSRGPRPRRRRGRCRCPGPARARLASCGARPSGLPRRSPTTHRAGPGQAQVHREAHAIRSARQDLDLGEVRGGRPEPSLEYLEPAAEAERQGQRRERAHPAREQRPFLGEFAPSSIVEDGAAARVVSKETTCTRRPATDWRCDGSPTARPLLGASLHRGHVITSHDLRERPHHGADRIGDLAPLDDVLRA